MLLGPLGHLPPGTAPGLPRGHLHAWLLRTRAPRSQRGPAASVATEIAGHRSALRCESGSGNTPGSTSSSMRPARQRRRRWRRGKGRGEVFANCLGTVFHAPAATSPASSSPSLQVTRTPSGGSAGRFFFFSQTTARSDTASAADGSLGRPTLLRDCTFVEQTLKRVPFDPLFKCQSLQVTQTPASSADGSLGRPTLLRDCTFVEQTLKRVPFDPLFKCQSLQVTQTPASSADGSLGRPTNDASHSHTATAMTMTTRARSGAARAAAGAALALVLALVLSGAAAGARLGEKGARPSELRVMPG